MEISPNVSGVGGIFVPFHTCLEEEGGVPFRLVYSLFFGWFDGGLAPRDMGLGGVCK